MSAWDELGPKMPTRQEVYREASETIQLLQIARELSVDGPQTDVPRAVQLLAKARARLDGVVPQQ